MKQLYFIITISLCLLPLTGMQAQRTLQIEAIPGQFAEQLTEEQMATVEELTLTGELCNSDFATLRSMESLRVLDMTDALVDTIPGYASIENDFIQGAFYGLETISLPKTLKIIGDYAFFFAACLTTVHWTAFPEKFGEHVFEACSKLSTFITSGDALTTIDGVLFTSDKKTLLLYPTFSEFVDEYIYAYIVPEGTVAIGEKAFMDTSITVVTLPETLQEIGEKSFWTTPPRPTGNDNRSYYELLSNVSISSPTPPVCHGDPFGLNIVRKRPSLKVPPEYKEAYEDDPYWKLFFEPVGILSHKKPTASIRVEKGTLRLSKHDAISEIRLFSTNGSLAGVYKTPCPATINLPQKGIYIAEIIYKDGQKKNHKLFY